MHEMRKDDVAFAGSMKIFARLLNVAKQLEQLFFLIAQLMY